VVDSKKFQALRQKDGWVLEIWDLYKTSFWKKKFDKIKQSLVNCTKDTI